jgi:hypothetical protein
VRDAATEAAPAAAAGAAAAGAAAGEEAEEAPPHLRCCITMNLMQRPVVCADGHTYDRDAILRWFGTGSTRSPMTNRPLSHTRVVPNHALRHAIAAWREGRGGGDAGGGGQRQG